MRITHSPWFGFLLGFLFGTLGMWVFAILSLAIPAVEYASTPLFWFGRWVSATFVEQNGSVGNGGVALLMLTNGLFYGVIGMLLQKVFQKK